MFRTVLSVVLSRGLGGLSQAFLLVILVRELGPIEFGYYTLISTIAGFALAILGFGLNTQALRIGTKDNPFAWGNQIVILRNISMIFVAVTIFLVLKALNFEHLDIAILALLFVLFETSSGTVEAVLFGLQKTTSAQSNLIVRRLVILLITILGLKMGFSIVQSNGAALTLGTLVSAFWTRPLWGHKVSKVTTLRTSAPYWLPSILSKLGTLDVLVAQISLSQLAFGVFSASSRIVNTFQLLPNAFLSVMTPHLVRAGSSHARYLQTSRFLKHFFIGGIVFGIASPLIARVIVLVVGPGYPGLFIISVLLILAFLVNCVNQILSAFFYAEGKPTIVSGSSSASVFAGLLAIWAFASLWAAPGAAFGVVLMQMIQFSFLYVYYQKGR